MAIKADASLVQAASKEAQTGAMADVPSLKPLYESTAKISETVMGTVTGIMDQIKLEKELESIAKEKRLKPINDAAKSVYNSLYDGGEPLPEIFINSFTERIEELQDEFEKVNTEGEGDTKANAKKRREINGELTRLKNEAINVRKNFMISTQDPDKWNVGRIKDEDEAPLTSIFGLWTDPKNPGGITSKIVNGKLQVTVNGRSFNSEDIVSALNYKNPQNDSYFIGGAVNSVKLGMEGAKAPGAVKGGGAYYNDVTKGKEVAEITAWLNEDPGRYSDVAGRRIDGLNAASFKNALRDRVDISFAVLDRMFVNENETINTDLVSKIKALDKSGKDGKPDGIINSKDAEGLEGDALKKFMANFDLISNAILDPENENFNKELSYKMLAEYHVGIREQSYNDSYEAQWKIDNPIKETPKTGLTLNYGYRELDQMQSDYNHIKSGKEGDSVNAYVNGVIRTFTRKKDGTWSHAHADGELIKTPEQMRQLKEYFHLPVISGKEGEESEKVTTEETNEGDDEGNILPPIVSNTKPAVKGVSYPPMSITSKTITPAREKTLNDLYKKFGVEFKIVGTGGEVMITHIESGNTQLVEMNRYGKRRNMESQDLIQQFILNYVK